MYTTCIVPYLNILGEFDIEKTREIERDLIECLAQVGCSEARYRRFKTDRDHSTPLTHLEAEAIYDFFTNRFNSAIKDTQDSRMSETLEAWIPTSTLNIYWRLPAARATG